MSLNHHFFRLFIRVLLITALESTEVWAKVECYQCVWMEQSEIDIGILPSTVDISDVCRPENFQPDIVHKDACPYACRTTIFYEHGHKQNAKYGSQASDKNEKREEILLKPQITFFYRGCSTQYFTTSGCERISFIKIEKEDCFCMTDLCNGIKTSGCSRKTTRHPGISEIPYIVISLLLTFL